MAEEKALSMVSLVKIIKEEERKFLEENSEENVRKFVRETLNGQKEDLLKKYLGFSKDSFSRKHWEIDHCNGRAGDSPVGKTIKKIAEEELVAWMGDAIKEMAEKTFDENHDLYNPIMKEIKQIISYKLRDTIRQSVRDRVFKFVEGEVERQLKHHTDEVAFLKEMIDDVGDKTS